MDFAQALLSRAPAFDLKRDVPLAPYTTMRVGGRADFFGEITSEEDLRAAMLAAAETNTPILILGNGSNMVVRDGGIEGAVLRLGEDFSQIQVEGTLLTAQAGALLSCAARAALGASLTGMEFASGIPGSVGGGTFMNAGAYGGELSQIVEFVDVLENGVISRVSGADMRYAYRHSRLMETGGIALKTGFRLKKGESRAILDLMNELNARRRDKQPLAYPSAGSFFKRPQGYFAGTLIEQAGLKGKTVGGAQVSEKHAGFLINTGNATAQDVLDLMAFVQKTVYEKFGVRLEPEVRILGREK